jgi:histone H3/H4
MPESKIEPKPEQNGKKPVPTKTAKKQSSSNELPLATVIRIAKKHGAERVGEDAALILAEIGEAFIAKTVRNAMTYAKVAGRKTLKKEDLDLVLKPKVDLA